MDCAFDNDTLVDLNCSAGELAKFNGSDWACGEDIDTVLDADTVISCVEQNPLSIPSAHRLMVQIFLHRLIHWNQNGQIFE